MNDIQLNSAVQRTQNNSQNTKISGWLYKLLPVVLLVCGVFVAWYLMNTAPRASTVKTESKARLVNVATIEKGSFTPVVSVSGEVKAAQKLSLYPRVSGRVTALATSLLPGSVVEKNEVLLMLDSDDYELVVREKQSALDKALAELQQEKGQQAIARREYALMGQLLDKNDEELVLRKPQLAMAMATIEAARVQLESAQLDLQRTEMTAPFTAQIGNRYVEIGSEVTTGTVLADLVSTDEFWLEASVPLDQLEWIVFPDEDHPGSLVKITSTGGWEAGTFREGRVLSLLPELENGSRMAKVLISIKDPLAQLPENKGKQRILVNDFLQAEIQGLSIDDKVGIPREWLRGGNQVWLMDALGNMEIRQIEIRFRGRDAVMLNDNLQAGEHVVISMLPVAIEGMPLRVLPDEITKQESGKNAVAKEERSS